MTNPKISRLDDFASANFRYVADMGIYPPVSNSNEFSYLATLFPKKTRNEVYQMIADSTVLDIAAGGTPDNPNSFVNRASIEGKNVKVFALDPTYDPEFKTRSSSDDKQLCTPMALERKFTILLGHIYNFIRTGKLNKETRACKLVAGDANNLPFADQSMDLVTISNYVGRYIYTKEKVVPILEEAWRVLKPGGELRIHPVSMKEDDNFLSLLDPKIHKSLKKMGDKTVVLDGKFLLIDCIQVRRYSNDHTLILKRLKK